MTVSAAVNRLNFALAAVVGPANPHNPQTGQERMHGDDDARTRFFVKPGYSAREETTYFVDEGEPGLVYQPDVYPLAAHIARMKGCSTILDLGCGRAGKLASLHPEFSLVGVDFGANIDHCRRSYSFGTWIEADLEARAPLATLDIDLSDTVIICADVIEHLRQPDALLDLLGHLLENAGAAVISTPERDLVRGPDDLGPPANAAHVREWSLSEFRKLLEYASLPVAFSGLTVNNDRDWQKRNILAVLDSDAVRPTRAPDGFAAMAIMTVYNEVDIVIPAIEGLLQQGVSVHVIDNWSSDGSYELVRDRLVASGPVTLERYPTKGPSDRYEWRRLLRRVEEISCEAPADWVVHHDCDERRRSPWAGVSLLDALAHVDRVGYTAVDHTVIEFVPTDSAYPQGTDFEKYFTRFRFGTRPGHFSQVKAWKRAEGIPDLVGTGGHDARIPGQRVYPYKFLLKHYPFRTQAQAERKVFRDRIPRWDEAERADGWHIQYDDMTAGHEFVRDYPELARYSEASFWDCYLVERLSGVGILRS